MDPLLAVAVGAAVAASAAAGRAVDFASVPRVGIQPRAPAFGIWGLLFPALGAAGVAAGTDAFPPAAVAALVGSLALTVAWARAATARAWRAAAAALGGAAGAAWAAALLAPAAPAAALPALVEAALGLYAGWVSVATALAAALAAPALDRPPTLALAAAAVGAAAAATRRPAPALAAAWACAWAGGDVRWAAAGGLAALGGGLGGALARVSDPDAPVA